MMRPTTTTNKPSTINTVENKWLVALATTQPKITAAPIAAITMSLARCLKVIANPLKDERWAAHDTRQHLH